MIFHQTRLVNRSGSDKSKKSMSLSKVKIDLVYQARRTQVGYTLQKLTEISGDVKMNLSLLCPLATFQQSNFVNTMISTIALR